MIREFGVDEAVYLLLAARWTIGLALAATLAGAMLGFIVAILRTVPIRLLNWIAGLYIGVIQGTPLIGQLFVAFFGLSALGLEVNPWTAAVVALSVYASAFLGEIWRGSLQSVPKEQWEASAGVGMSYLQRLRHVIVPQAVRISIPPTVGFLVQLVKNTSLASVIGFVELTRAGQIMSNATFEPLLTYMVVAAIYFVICFSLSLASRRLERSMHVTR